jgi:hypothetical protein
VVGQCLWHAKTKSIHLNYTFAKVFVRLYLLWYMNFATASALGETVLDALTPSPLPLSCRSLQPVKVGIVNLQVTATVPYQLFPLTPTPSSLPHYSSTLQQHRKNFVNSEGHVQQPMLSEQLYKAILGRLKVSHEISRQWMSF